MDVDNDNFYDEISSFMPTPGDYTSDDWDELIRSTDSQLDASLDLNLFSKSLEHHNDFDMEGSNDLLPNSMPLTTDTSVPSNVYNFNFSAFPSPATSHQSSGSSADYNSSSLYETSERTSSTSSLNGDCFNPDDFINFLNDDDVKIETAELTQDRHHHYHHHHHRNERNTPSPTGSCTSSSGSSTTSGIQSDISSVVSLPSQICNKAYSSSNEEQDELSEFIKFKMSRTDMSSESSMSSGGPAVLEVNENQNENQFRIPAIPTNDHCNSETSATLMGAAGGLVEATFVPLNMTLNTFTPVVQTVNVMQNSFIPVQTVAPLNSSPQQTLNNLENKNENCTLQQQQEPLIKPIPTTGAQSAPSPNNKVTTAPAAPPTAKPKTIFLSSNDFKALMQKMNNTNGNGNAPASSHNPGSRRNSLQNGQMPKIIMKTASGKYITANKMPASMGNTSPAQKQQQATPAKLFKPSMAKQQQQQPSKVVNSNNGGGGRTTNAMAALARASLQQQSKVCRSDFNMQMKGGLSEEKLIKKQLRMLKNRESASLSRKKKKEYVERLEQRISNLEKENYSLKGENASLRSQLMAFAKTCDCKHRNVSEFILNTLSMNENRHHGHENSTVLDDLDASFLIEEDDSSDQSDRCDSFSTSHSGSSTTNTSSSARPTSRHVRIAPKPLNNSTSSSIHRNFRHRMSSSNVKKNVAVLFAMAFMVTLNVGNFQSYLNKSALENALEASATPNESSETVVGGAGDATSGTGRRLLWVPNEHEFQEQNNRSKREADFHNMPPPPLHFLRPANRTHAEELNGTTTKDEPPILKPLKYGPTTTTTFGNGSTNYNHENNMRLARNLHKWIGVNDYLNLTDSGMGVGGRMTQFAQFGKGNGGAQYEDYQIPVGVGKQKRKILYETEENDVEEGGVSSEKQKKYIVGEGQNSLGLFKPRISEEYLRLFKGIKRQDDTFYVLSFNLDHILLPASAYNKSARPKMSLMLPAGDSSMDGKIVLMQIDCEVMNTTEIELKSHMIPEKLRPSLKFGPNDVANNETKNTGATGPAKASHGGGEIHLKREEESKEKPPRTYFMMGPKNQPSVLATNGVKQPVLNGEQTVIKKRPTIVKLNANDSVIGSGIMNVRNSALFTRMKDTVVNSNGSGLVTTASTVSEVRKLK